MIICTTGLRNTQHAYTNCLMLCLRHSSLLGEVSTMLSTTRAMLQCELVLLWEKKKYIYSWVFFPPAIKR